MAFIDDILETPSYGWRDSEGNLIKPRAVELFREFFRRLNIFKSIKNWLPLTSWGSAVILIPMSIIYYLRIYFFNALFMHKVIWNR